MEDTNTQTQTPETSNSEPQTPSLGSRWADLPNYIKRVIKVGSTLLIFGGVLILLFNLNIAVGHLVPPEPNTNALAVGMLACAAFTLIGIPLVPAAIAGVAIWVFVEGLLN